MFMKALKLSAKVAAAIIFVEDDTQDNEQLEQLTVGYGHIVADGEHMTNQEAEQAQSRGELYDVYH